MHPAEIKKILKENGLFAKKSLGQNFLISEKALSSILKAAKILQKDYVVEIGPGLGVLTKKLVLAARKTTVVELDHKLSALLEKKLQTEVLENRLEVLTGNALDFSPPEKAYKVVANIPYNITSPLLNHFLQAKNPPLTMTLLVQKEVAEKAAASPDRRTGERRHHKHSILSLQVQLFGEPKVIKTVPRTAFFPVPKVDSAILHIKIAPAVPGKQAVKILKTAKRAFAQGRKKLKNTLPELKNNLRKFQLSDKRPEDLTIEEWQKITN